jgi:aspartyl-tRNA(Asn)/glutamyl-tRNA(Gln) amidotransferase subunit C
MDKIIDAVSTLAELDTSKVEPYGSSAQGQANLRQDHIKPSLSVDQALANAPAKGSEGFAVPAIHD